MAVSQSASRQQTAQLPLRKPAALHRGLQQKAGVAGIGDPALASQMPEARCRDERLCRHWFKFISTHLAMTSAVRKVLVAEFRDGGRGIISQQFVCADLHVDLRYLIIMFFLIWLACWQGYLPGVLAIHLHVLHVKSCNMDWQHIVPMV